MYLADLATHFSALASLPCWQTSSRTWHAGLGSCGVGIDNRGVDMEWYGAVYGVDWCSGYSEEQSVLRAPHATHAVAQGVCSRAHKIILLELELC